MRDTAVVVPCYNESKRLDTRAFRDYAALDRHVTFLFVNDGSTDGTLEILEELGRSDPEAFRVLGLERNSGKAEAVRRGVVLALDSGPAYVGYWDADLATPLDVIGAFRDLLEENARFDVVLGSRVRLLGREVRRSPKRHYLGRAFATIASFVLGLSVYDTQCGAKLFRATPETLGLFQDPFRSTWIFDVEVLARLVRARHGPRRPGADLRLGLYEYPLHRWHDVDGSKLKARDFLRAPLELLAIYRHYLAGNGRGGRAATSPSAPRPHIDLVARDSAVARPKTPGSRS